MIVADILQDMRFELEKDEADALAPLFARLVKNSKWNQLYGKDIVHSKEYFMVGNALYSYGKRVVPAVVEKVRQNSAKHPRKTEFSSATSEQNSQQNGNGTYSANTVYTNGLVPIGLALD